MQLDEMEVTGATHMAAEPMGRLCSLPLELLCLILDNLTFDDILDLREANRTLYRSILPTVAMAFHDELPIRFYTPCHLPSARLHLRHARFLTTRHALQMLFALTSVPEFLDRIETVSFCSGLSHLQNLDDFCRGFDRKTQETLVAEQLKFEASGSITVLLGKIFEKLSSGATFKEVHLGIFAHSHVLDEVEYFGIWKTLDDVGTCKILQRIDGYSERGYYRIYPQSLSILDLDILLNIFDTSGIAHRSAIVLTIHPSGTTESANCIYRKVRNIFVRNPQLANTITDIVLAEPAHKIHHINCPRFVPFKLLNALHSITSLNFAGSPHSACFDDHPSKDIVPSGWIPRYIELRCWHNVVGGKLCRGCLKVSSALEAIHLPNLKKLTMSRIHLTDGQKLVDFSVRHQATLEEIVIEQCMLSEKFASWEHVLSELGRSDCMPETLRLDGRLQHDEAYVEQRVEEGRGWRRSVKLERDGDSGLGIGSAFNEFVVGNMSKKECNALQQDIKYTCVLFKEDL